MAIDSISAKHWKRARIKNAVLNRILLAEFGSLIYIFSHSESITINQGRFFAYQYYFSMVASIWLALSRQKSKRKAILRYNSLFDKQESKQTVVKLEFQPILLFPQNEEKQFASGLGVRLKF